MTASYPGTIQTFTSLSGTAKLSSPDHTVEHTLERGNIVAIETVLGTTAGTSVLKDFVAGNFAEKKGSISFGTTSIPLSGTAPSASQYLKYDGTNIVGAAASGGTSLTFGTTAINLSTTVPSASQYLKYDGTNIVGGSVAANSPTFTETFIIPGVVGTGTNMSKTWLTPAPLTIGTYILWTPNAGATGTTAIDINVSGTTIITAKPSLIGTAVLSSGTTDAPVGTIAGSVPVTIDVDTVTTTAQNDLYVYIKYSIL